MPTFEELHTLITLISEHSQQPLPLLGRLERQPGKESTLFENIGKGNYRSDEQAAADLYGQVTPGKSYAMLKSRLYDKLLNHLFFLDFDDPRFLPYAAKERESLGLLYQAKMLINSGDVNLINDLLKGAYAIAEELGLTTICIECLECWRYYYVRHDLVDAFQKNHERLIHYRKIAQYEKEAEDLYQAFRLEMRNPVHNRKKFLTELPLAIARMEIWWQKHYSANVYSYKFLLQIFYYEQIGDFQSVIQMCEEVQQLIQQRRVHPLRFDQRLRKYTIVYACLRFKDYQKGLLIAQDSIKSFLPSTLNWFAFVENYFLLAVHAQSYPLAERLLRQINDNPAQFKLTAWAREKWDLYFAYFSLLSPVGNSTDYQMFRSPGTVPTQFTKDKQGFNVAILILQFLQVIKTGDVELLISRIESLKQYAKRHLSDRTAQRSRLFIRLLALIPQHWDNAEVCRRKGEKLLTQLVATPSPGDAYAEIEIVPYEHLWDWVLAKLNSKE